MKKERPYKRYTTEKFIDLAKKKHGEKYIYSEVNYTFSNVKVDIICPTHGRFLVTPAMHLSRTGCDKCADAKNGLACRKSQADFIMECITLWGDTYDYSLVEYTHNKHKIKIICKKHGVFEKAPSKHINGQGCPSCTKSGFKKDISAFLYVLSDGTLTKIGITNREVKERVRTIRKSSGKNLNIIKAFECLGKVASDVEDDLLQIMRECYEQPKEKYDGSTECFYNVNLPALLTRIEQLIESQTAAQAA